MTLDIKREGGREDRKKGEETLMEKDLTDGKQGMREFLL